MENNMEHILLTCMFQERTHVPGGRRVVTVEADSDNTEAVQKRNKSECWQLNSHTITEPKARFHNKKHKSKRAFTRNNEKRVAQEELLMKRR
jgi:hypothetical protein